MNVIHNVISVELSGTDCYTLYFQDDDGNNSEHICHVYGRDNAIEVAKRISHQQVEYIKYPMETMTHAEFEKAIEQHNKRHNKHFSRSNN